MQLAIVSDELKLPQREAFALIRDWGIRHVELRGLTGGRIPDGDVDEVHRLVESFGMTVTSLSPGVFKCPPDAASIDDHLNRLDQTISICKRLAVHQIIVFPIQNPDQSPTDGTPTSLVIDAMREAGRRAREHGIRFAIENEPGYTAVTARGLATLIDSVGMQNVGANWDPGNAYPWDREIDDAIDILGDRIFNVHVKDTWVRNENRGFDSVGNGDIDWKRLVDQLSKRNYDGCIVVETHCSPEVSVEKSRENVDILRRLIGDRKSDRR
jgi:sugar phosphate isomerase/epimerase